MLPEPSRFRTAVSISLMAWTALASSAASAALTVSPIFGSNMVVQRGQPVPVSGTADPGATISVQFQSQSVSTVANAGGRWQAELSAMSATAFPETLIVSSGTETVSFTGVHVGEVWLCAGQSNMGWPLSSSNGGAAAIADASRHTMRLFRMTAGNGPSTTSWQVSDANTTPNFSAVCYWMGLDLSQRFEDVPIGLVQATHDGTAISHWQHTSGGEGDDYDAMVRAIQPFPVRGVAWYQGESNGGDTGYATKLATMIGEWRNDWDLPGLPFGIVQLADHSGWNAARNAQLVVSETVPACFLVVIKDLPGGVLHPPEKKPVGIRTAIGARGAVYGEAIPYSGPVRDPAASFVSGSTVVLHWSHLGDGLFTGDGAAPGPFKLAGTNGRFKTANAAIVGDTVEVWSSGVTEPAKVQFAYSGAGNLFNAVSIPTEGGAAIVDRLKASEFEIAVTQGSPPGCSPTRLHVASIVKGSWSAGRGNRGGSAQVLVQDDCGSALVGSTVTGTFSGGFDETTAGVTDGSGTATVDTVATAKGTVSYTFCVDDVTGALPYDPGANAETCE